MARKSFGIKYVECYRLYRMKILELNKVNSKNPITATIGIFDGLHKGHQKILEELKQNKPNAVLTFYKHPRNIKTLQPFAERLRTIKKAGINTVVIFTSKDKIMGMTTERFIGDIIKKLNIKTLVVGSDSRMGRNRESGTTDLKAICENNNITLTVIDVVCDHGKKLSSTDIRGYVEHGDVPKATSLLGHSFELNGVVVKGKGNGEKIGFRTANIQLSSLRTLPDHGIYVSRTHLDLGTFPSVTFIGTSPTIHLNSVTMQNPLVETHIIGFEQDLYGKKMHVELIEKIRDIKKFANLIELSNAIAKDVELAVKRLHSYK